MFSPSSTLPPPFLSIPSQKESSKVREGVFVSVDETVQVPASHNENLCVPPPLQVFE